MSDPDSGSPIGSLLHHTPKLGIPVEMLQFLMKLLLKQRILAVYHDFHQWRSKVRHVNPNVCDAPLNGAPFPSMRPFLVPIEVETRTKKFSKINIVLRLVKRKDLRAGLYPTCYLIA